MMCFDSISAFALRSLGMGERRLPRSDIELCDQIVLIGSGMIWNIYFAVIALSIGFCFAVALAVGKSSANPWLRLPSAGFVFLFRGSPLFIQFFFAYSLFSMLPKAGFEIDLGLFVLNGETRWLLKAWLGATIVLTLNTAAYSAEIFYGALKSVPSGDIEAAKAYGMTPWARFRRIIWPSMLRLAWPSYTNEAIFLFHSTALVYFSAFPAWRQQGDGLYYASYFAEKTFNPFVAYPIAAGFFILGTLLIILCFGLINTRLNKHLAPNDRSRIRYKPQVIR